MEHKWIPFLCYDYVRCLLISQDMEMSNGGQACEEFIFSQYLGTSQQTVSHSQLWAVQKSSHTHTHTQTLHICAIDESESSGLG